jgi:hypothetical protein
MSVGNKISPLWPVALTVCVPSGLNVVLETDPSGRMVTEFPVSRLVYVRRKPLPAGMI